MKRKVNADGNESFTKILFVVPVRLNWGVAMIDLELMS